MFLKIYFVLALLTETLICLCTDILSGWVDFWIPIVLFLSIFLGLSALHILFSLVVSWFFNKKKLCDRPNKFCRFWVYVTVELMLDFARVKVEVKGAEKIPTDKRFLLVSNHRSNLDPMINIVHLYKNEIAYISKPENFKIPAAGPFIHKCCFLPIDRENARNAMKTIHRATDFVKNDITSVGVYPEGTRSKTGELLEFKDGVFYICKKAPCPLVVTTVKNTEKIGKNFPFNRTVVYLDVLDVLYPEDFSDSSTHDLSKKVRNMMLENLK